jgi:hypothetical protein
VLGRVFLQLVLPRTENTRGLHEAVDGCGADVDLLLDVDPLHSRRSDSDVEENQEKAAKGRIQAAGLTQSIEFHCSVRLSHACSERSLHSCPARGDRARLIMAGQKCVTGKRLRNTQLVQIQIHQEAGDMGVDTRNWTDRGRYHIEMMNLCI